MNKEIELKARINNHQNLRDRLEDFYGEPEVIDKDDIYYQYVGNFNSEGRQSVRLRRENGKNVVTLKRKTLNGSVEINDELEFSVDNSENFLSFLNMTGAVKWILKSKKGWRFKDSSEALHATVELCEVGQIGWFIEIEVVVETDEIAVIRKAEKRIKDILRRLEIPESAIEPRYYSEMILGLK